MRVVDSASSSRIRRFRAQTMQSDRSRMTSTFLSKCRSGENGISRSAQPVRGCSSSTNAGSPVFFRSFWRIRGRFGRPASRRARIRPKATPQNAQPRIPRMPRIAETLPRHFMRHNSLDCRSRNCVEVVVDAETLKNDAVAAWTAIFLVTKLCLETRWNIEEQDRHRRQPRLKDENHGPSD